MIKAVTEAWPDWFGRDAQNPVACKSLKHKFNTELHYYLAKVAAQMGLPDKSKFTR
jgi:hypothetical protein